MDSGPEGDLRYMSCTSGESGNLQKAKGASQRTMVVMSGELVSASENCIGPNSFLTSQMHQLPPHLSGR